MPATMPLSARGRYIIDADGRRVRLAGVNWYGAHEDDGVAVGLERTDRRALARTIAVLGFNCVRLPFSLWMTQQTAPVRDQYLAANPDLSGATPLQVYDACVEALTGAGLIVIPNCHTLDPGWCCSDDANNGLWHNDRWPAARFFETWQDMAARYSSSPLVAAMDIVNEPRRARVGWRVLTPTWGSGHKTDLACTTIRGFTPVTGRRRSNWGDPEPWGLLTPDWRNVANPRALDILTSMIPPRTGPGTS